MFVFDYFFVKSDSTDVMMIFFLLVRILTNSKCALRLTASKMYRGVGDALLPGVALHSRYL